MRRSAVEHLCVSQRRTIRATPSMVWPSGMPLQKFSARDSSRKASALYILPRSAVLGMYFDTAAIASRRIRVLADGGIGVRRIVVAHRPLVDVLPRVLEIGVVVFVRQIADLFPEALGVAAAVDDEGGCADGADLQRIRGGRGA